MITNLLKQAAIKKNIDVSITKMRENYPLGYAWF